MKSAARPRLLFAAALAAAGLPLAACGDEANLDRLRQFLVAGSDTGIPPVPQGGRNAEAIGENLKRIRLPPGFRIELYAVVPDARHLAVGPSANMVFVGTRRATVWAVTDRNGDGVVDEVRAFAPALKFRVPNGVCFTRNGVLIVVEHNRVLGFPAAESSRKGADVATIEIVPQGRLIPPEEESANHAARVCRVGPDQRLYVALGQPFNVPPRDKLARFEQWGIGGIVRMNAFDGSGREVYARGIRNSVGMDFNPKNGELWFTDNQTDGMGDDRPPGELNRATRPGQHFGYPWVCGQVRIAEHGYDRDPLPAGAVYPEIEFPAHAADLGMAFYTGTQFPPRYRGGIFSAQHGSWNRSVPIGARIMFTSLKADGSADRSEVFAEGWLDAETHRYRGRPVDVAMLADGSLLVSDDFAGALYRISHVGQ